MAGTSLGRRMRDRAAQGMAAAAFAATELPLASILWLVVGHGAKRFDSVFLNNSMCNIAESDQGGGADHAILGTLEQAGIATLIAVPHTLRSLQLSRVAGGNFAPRLSRNRA
jgi:phosphate transport system permease protein